jgi:hypothetical protein
MNSADPGGHDAQIRDWHIPATDQRLNKSPSDGRTRSISSSQHGHCTINPNVLTDFHHISSKEKKPPPHLSQTDSSVDEVKHLT